MGLNEPVAGECWLDIIDTLQYVSAVAKGSFLKTRHVRLTPFQALDVKNYGTMTTCFDDTMATTTKWRSLSQKLDWSPSARILKDLIYKGDDFFVQKT